MTALTRLGGRNEVEDGRQAVAKPTGAGRSLCRTRPWRGPCRTGRRSRCSPLPRPAL